MLKVKASGLYQTVLRTTALTDSHKYIAWKTLIESQTFYQLLTIAKYDQSSKSVVQDIYYTLLKTVLRMKGRPNKAHLLRETIGDPQEYLNAYLDAIVEKSRVGFTVKRELVAKVNQRM